MPVTERKIKLSSTLPKVEKEETMIDDMKNDAIMAFVESLLPKLTPMIEKASVKLKEYFGDNEKIFLIRRLAGEEPKVIVLNNTKGRYTISNEAKLLGDGEDAEIEIKEVFKALTESVIATYDTGEFVAKLLSGEFNTK